MDWTQHVNIYCERHSAAFWAEPTNAITNIAFILAALAALVYARRRGALDGAIWALVGLMFLIGLSSFLFHTVAEVWAGAADTLSIQLFIVVYFVLAMRRFAGFSWWLSGLATAGFMAFSFLGGDAVSPLVGDALNGSESYLPPLLGLIVVGALLVRAERAGAGRSLIAGACIFAVSLVFRTIDNDVCAAFPLGTHFLWHILNGLLLGFLVSAMARFGVRGAKA
ncbi:MAG: ceramidase domain-containing protein [Acuticoccus sp.]